VPQTASARGAPGTEHPRAEHPRAEHRTGVCQAL